MDKSADRQRDFDAFVMSAKGETSTKSFQDWAGGERGRHETGYSGQRTGNRIKISNIKKQISKISAAADKTQKGKVGPRLRGDDNEQYVSDISFGARCLDCARHDKVSELLRSR